MPTRNFFLLLIAGCSLPLRDDSGGEPGSDLSEGVGPAFVNEGEGWVTAAPIQGLGVRVDDLGATVRWHDARVRLGTSGGAWTPAPCGAAPCAPRLERVEGEITEWWETRADRLEHGFDVASSEAPELRVEVPVDGASLRVVGDSVMLSSPGSLGLTYSELVVTDDAGRRLPAALSTAGDRIRITVDTTGATFPVHIDPSLTPATWFLGPGTSDSFGDSSALLGDVNGDGYDDLAVYGGTSSSVYVYHGSATGLSSTAATTITKASAVVSRAGDVDADGYDDLLVSTSSGANIYYGTSTGITTGGSSVVSPSGAGSINAVGAGDVNGDGYDDVLVGRPNGESGSETDEGLVYLYHGAATGLSGAWTWSWQSNQASAYAGYSLAFGDYDGDSYDDVAVGAYSYDDGSTNEGAVFVFFGGTGTMSATPDVTIEANTASASFGRSLATVGDVDGDGDEELAVGSTGYGSYGAVFVQRGSASGPPTTPDWTLTDASVTGLGSVLSEVGDVDADGVPDLAAGLGSKSVAATNDGGVLLWLGSSTGFASSADLVVPGGTNGSKLGTSVAGGGDVDGDGYADVFAGAPAYYGSSSSTVLGRMLALYGQDGGPATWATWSDTWKSTHAGDYFGSRIKGIGDVNGDGYGDTAICGNGYNSVYIFHGGATGMDALAATSLRITTSYFGGGPYAHGDFDADGYDDFVIGSYSWTNPTTSEGYVGVFEGAVMGLGTTAAWTVESGQASAYLGSGVAVADFDHDGFDDLAVGASGYDFGQSNEGIVFLYEGSATGLSTTSSWYWDADVASAAAGGDLAAGDVDGDGYPDLIVAAEGWADGETGEGAVFIFSGSASGLASSPAWTLEPDVVGAGLGSGLAVGDFDGDGYADVAAGASAYDNGESNEGAIFVWLGGPAGPASAADFTWEADSTTAGVGGDRMDAADVDGDGYDELLAGSYYYYDPYVYDGRAWVFHGSAAGLSADAVYSLSYYDRFAEFGLGIGGSDVDGDGRAEVLVGAPYADQSISSTSSGRVMLWDLDDSDADGEFDLTDCDDADASTYTGGIELCDGVDNDCDGAVDEDVPTWFADADGDGYGDAATTTTSCTAPAGYVTDDTDCNDGAAAAHPGASETCDGIDDDCDGLSDEAGEPGELPWYADADGDGYGDAASVSYACSAPSGSVADATDCDDSLASVTDGIDWYTDADGDGYGDAAAVVRACTVPAGAVADATDCDDTAAGVSPAGVESCDGVDQDCDGSVDEGVKTEFYADLDGDGYGGSTVHTSACTAPVGFVANTTDCDDGTASVNPGATETCDGVDNDCDSAVDEGLLTTFYGDADSDGYGVSGTTTSACTVPSGYAALATDCDDADATAHPGGAEVCDGADDDCDGAVDEGTLTTYYLDTDADGYGDVGHSTSACAAPAGYVLPATDCDDAAGDVYPGAAEVCDNRDQDCDGTVDEGVVPVWYADADGDGLGAVGSPTASCTMPTGYVENTDDCDDTDAAVGGPVELWRDADGDTFGDPAAAIEACASIGGYVADGTDCDDTNAGANPGETEAWYDGVDQDCDGNDADQDGDGAAVDVDCDDLDATAAPGNAEVWYDGVDEACDGGDDDDADGDGLASDLHGGTDCDDADASVYPGAPDTPYDGKLQDCTHLSDNDVDVDGHDDAGHGGDDCDDADAAIHPGVAEVWYDGIDQDCDGNDGDQDADGFALTYDCDDTDPAINPDAMDVEGDGIDQDCSGADEAKAEATGCGCATEGGPASLFAGVAAALLLGSRRRRPGR